MADIRRERRLGIILVIAAAIAWSTAPFFTRLLSHDSWTILFWRSVFASGLRELVAMERSGWLVASLSMLAMLAFIPPCR